jgi:lysozyme
MPSDMKISDKGLQTLIDSEGSAQETYLDQAGLPTIGVGHCLTRSEISSGKIELSNGSMIDLRNNRISQTNIKRLLQDDLTSRENLVNRLVKVPLAQGQFDALVHFVFNVGNGAFKNSTLLKKLNRGDYSAVSNEIRKWNIVTVAGQKQVSDGLANRREVECSMWESCQPEGQVKRKTRKRSSKSSKSRQKSKATVKNGSEKPVYKSKVIGTAIATAAAYLATKFGIEVPAEFQATIESSIVLAGLAGIGILRKWFTNTTIR